MSPWLTGCARAPWALPPTKETATYLALLALKITFCLQTPSCVSLYLFLSLTQTHFFLLPWSYSYPHKRISSPLFEILLWRPGNLLGLGYIHKSGPHTLVEFFSISGTFSRLGLFLFLFTY